MFDPTTGKHHLLSLAQKDVIKKAGIVCLALAIVVLFFDLSAAVTLAVLGVEGIVLKRLHGKRVEDAAFVCWAGGFPLIMAIIVIGPWNLIGGAVLVIAGGMLWSEGF